MIATDMVQESFARCNLNAKFIDVFYENFLASNPMFAEMFAHTDFKQQKELLRRGISMMILYADGNAVGRLALQRLGKSHGKHGMGIPPAMYNFWLESLIKTVAQVDPRWDHYVEKQWRDTMQHGIRHIIEEGEK
ncbi:MAG: globin [Nitrospirae bacterium]|nr:globin [Nitrospirota bacterium]